MPNLLKENLVHFGSNLKVHKDIISHKQDDQFTSLSRENTLWKQSHIGEAPPHYTVSIVFATQHMR